MRANSWVCLNCNWNVNQRPGWVKMTPHRVPITIITSIIYSFPVHINHSLMIFNKLINSYILIFLYSVLGYRSCSSNGKDLELHIVKVCATNHELYKSLFESINETQYSSSLAYELHSYVLKTTNQCSAEPLEVIAVTRICPAHFDSSLTPATRRHSH